MANSLRDRLEAARERIRTQGGAQPACNMVVVSDHHLGESIKEHRRVEYLKRMAEIDRDFCQLLEHYGDNRVDERPWRMVINGDFLDLLTVTVMPSERIQASIPELVLDEEEKIFGLDSDEEKVPWKIARIADRHQVLFAYLADFVGRGNYLDMLYGNHDAEFFWPKAKVAFVQELTDTFFGTEKVVGVTERGFRGRIRWHEWFYYEPGKFYIEHGSQYDDFSSFEYRLNPVLSVRDKHLEMPVSHMAIRYFVNRLDQFNTHNKDAWTLVTYLRWLSHQGWTRVRFIIVSYVALSRRMLSVSRQIQEVDPVQIEATHLARMEELGEIYDLDLETLRQLDNFRNRPVHITTGGAIQAIGIDLWATILAMLILLGITLALPMWRFRLVGLLLWSGLVVGRKHVVRMVRNRFLGGEVSSIIPPKLDKAAEQIAELLDVRYVLFGHTHRPLMRQVRLDPPAWYINTGAFIPPEEKERHQGGCRSPLTYAVILDRGVPEAKLLRWCQRQQAPEPFHAHLPAEAEAPEIPEVKDDGAQQAEPEDDRAGETLRGPRRKREPIAGLGRHNPSAGERSLRKKRY